MQKSPVGRMNVLKSSMMSTVSSDDPYAPRSEFENIISAIINKKNPLLSKITSDKPGNRLEPNPKSLMLRRRSRSLTGDTDVASVAKKWGKLRKIASQGKSTQECTIELAITDSEGNVQPGEEFIDESLNQDPEMEPLRPSRRSSHADSASVTTLNETGASGRVVGPLRRAFTLRTTEDEFDDVMMYSGCPEEEVPMTLDVDESNHDAAHDVDTNTIEPVCV